MKFVRPTNCTVNPSDSWRAEYSRGHQISYKPTVISASRFPLFAPPSLPDAPLFTDPSGLMPDGMSGTSCNTMLPLVASSTSNVQSLFSPLHEPCPNPSGFELELRFLTSLSCVDCHQLPAVDGTFIYTSFMLDRVFPVCLCFSIDTHPPQIPNPNPGPHLQASTSTSGCYQFDESTSSLKFSEVSRSSRRD